MKEYKIMIHLTSYETDTWYKYHRQPVFTSKEDALAWIEMLKERHIKEKVTEYLDATYKIREREVSEWKDCTDVL